MGEVLQFEQKPTNFNVYDLFLNMSNQQGDLNKDFTDTIFYLKRRYEWLKSAVIALTLFLIVSIGALAWSIHDFKTKPVTVLLENQVQELDKLPLPPLEELKGE